MSKILEIFGRAVNIKTSDVIWHWLNLSIQKEDFHENIDQILEILDLISNLKFHLADEKLQHYEIVYPSSKYGLMAQATLSLKRNNITHAIEILKKVYHLYPSNTMTLYSIGYCYENMGDIDTAMKYYQDSLKFKGYLQLPRQRLAAIYLNNGQITNSIEQYYELSKEYPDNTEFMVLLGYLYYANKQYKSAIKSFQKAITMHPDNFQMTGQLEDIDQYIADNDYEHAISAIQSKYEQFGNLPELHIKLSEIYQRRGENDLAISSLKQAKKIQPNNMQATIKMATLYLHLKRYDHAAEEFGKALELNDEIIDAYVGLTKSQIAYENKKDAIETLSLACAIQQNSNLLYGECASIQYVMAKLNCQFIESVPVENMIKSHYEKIKADPENSDSYYKLGLILMAAGDLNTAKGHFEQAIKINPYHFRANAKLSICLNESKNAEDGINVLKKELQIDQEIMSMHYKTALLYTNEQKFETAICRLRDSMKKNYTALDSINNITVVLENIGLIDRAAANYIHLEQTYI